MTLPILTIPHPILRRKSTAVAKVDKKTLEFIQNLEETLVKKKNPPGVGLSAPQVGKNWRIFSTYLPKANLSDRTDLKGKHLLLTTFINPVILSASAKLTLGPNKKEPILEGCLSIPKIYGPVFRHQSLRLKWLSPTGQSLTATFSGFTARVIQHELDHLDGILFTDRAMKDKLPLFESKNDKLVPISLSA